MKTCLWKMNDNSSWDTDCGECFEITDGTPSENKMAFCCYCGLPLDEVVSSDDPKELEADHRMDEMEDRRLHQEEDEP